MSAKTASDCRTSLGLRVWVSALWGAVEVPQRALMLFLGVMLALAGAAQGREWSEEIRMTHASEQRLQWDYGVVDKWNRIHTLYDYGHAIVPDSFPTQQAVYQVFNFQGDSLTEPLIIGVAADYRGTSVLGRCLAIGPENQVYILWSGDRAHNLTILDSTGEVSVPRIDLQELGYISDNIDPYLFVDSNGDLIVVSNLYIPFGQQPPESYDNRLAFARYHPDGELIDSVRFIGAEDQYVARLFCALDVGDTLHVCYQENINDVVHLRYSKILPDGTFLAEDFAIDEVGGQRGIDLSDLATDKLGRPLFTMQSNCSQFLMRLNCNLESDFEIFLGINEGGRAGSIGISQDGTIHLLVGFYRDDHIDEGRESLGYIVVSDEGEIIDSLQLIHSIWTDEGGYLRANFSSPQVFISDSSEVALMWLDQRQFEGPRSGNELLMRHSIRESSVPDEEVQPTGMFLLEPNYPNPFNGATTFRLRGATQGLIKMIITDLNGRQVFLGHLNSLTFLASFTWNGCDKFGIPLPAGSYMLTVSDLRNRQTRMVTLVR